MKASALSLAMVSSGSRSCTPSRPLKPREVYFILLLVTVVKIRAQGGLLPSLFTASFRYFLVQGVGVSSSPGQLTKCFFYLSSCAVKILFSSRWRCQPGLEENKSNLSLFVPDKRLTTGSPRTIPSMLTGRNFSLCHALIRPPLTWRSAFPPQHGGQFSAFSVVLDPLHTWRAASAASSATFADAFATGR